MDKRNLVYGLVNLTLCLVFVPLLFSEQFFRLSHQYRPAGCWKWVLTSYGFLLSATYFHQYLQSLKFLLPLFIGSFITGLVARKPEKTVSSIILANLFMGLVYDLSFLLFPLSLRDFTHLSQYPFFFLIIVNGFITGILGGLTGYIGSKLTETEVSPPLPKVTTGKPVTECPNCGFQFHSLPLFCANCGKKLREEMSTPPQ